MKSLVSTSDHDVGRASSGSGRTAARDGARNAWIPVAVTASFAIVVGGLSAFQPSAAGAVAALAMVVAVLSSTRELPAKVDLGGKRFRWVAFAWVYLMIRPIGHFTYGRTTLTAVGGVPSVENVIDLATHALIAGVALWSLKSNKFRLRPSWLVFALPGLALLSAAWSLAPTVTLGFSFELIVIAILATLTLAVQDSAPTVGRLILQRTLRTAVQLVAVLCLLGLIYPHRGGAAVLGAADDKRFTWPGEHPLAATAAIGFTLLIIVFAGRDVRFSRLTRIGLFSLFGVCFYLGQSRTAWAGLAVSALVGYWLTSTGNGRLRQLVGAVAIAGMVVLVVSTFGGTLTDYIYRGQSQQQVFGLNGRLGLWSFALDQLHTTGRWLVGYGLSSSRVLFASSTAWAGDAHSAWLELLVSLGLAGVITGAVFVVTLGGRLFRARPDDLLATRILPIIFVYVLVMSPTASGFAAPGPEPGLGFAILALCYAATASRQPSWSRASVPLGPRLARGLQPSAT